ncbi:hypothetical protein QQX98_002163 [Neonectria punicea]|uniref:Uncharacterized protein n=1 Tax=Neonectria punicea TaxID=979145 RepID=A0ABR1HK19_9HYPO
MPCQILIKCAVSSDSGETVCILDALDECNSGDRRQLIDQLKNFCFERNETSSSSSKLKFLITSRPYDDLEASFGRFSGAAAYLRFDGDDKSEEISQEINLGIDARMKDIGRSFSDEDRGKICARLKEMEHRTYLWLHLTFDIIEQSPCEYGRRTDIENLLSELPSQVSAAYEKILGRSKNQTQTEMILRIVLAAEQPLHLNEANIALTLDLRKSQFASHAALEPRLWPRDNFRTTVKNLCGLFVNVYDSKLSFIHQTAREFLINPERQGTWEGRLNMSKSHSTMSLACLHYLLLPDLATPVQNSLGCQERSFLPYASAYWSRHYNSQEDTIADQSRKNARMLCDVTGEQVGVWAPIYFERDSGWEPWADLALASYLGLKLVVEDILAEEKTDVDAEDRHSGMALRTTSERGHTEIVQMLPDKNANVDAEGGMLLNKVDDINAEGELYDTLLLRALFKAYAEIVQMLLNKVDNINPEGGVYSEALEAASLRGNKEIVQMLRQAAC